MYSQNQSPLMRLPGEIRNRIFEYVVTKAWVGKQPFEQDAYFYRPGYRYYDRRMEWALLCTCRRIYEETKHLPSLQLEAVLWYHRSPLIATEYARRVSTDQKSSAHTLHLFTQLFWLESWAGDALRKSEKYPSLRKIIITIRHSDWWNWESSVPLRLDPGIGQAPRRTIGPRSRFRPRPFRGLGGRSSQWGEQFVSFQHLAEVELELETREGKRVELDEIVGRASQWQFPAANGDAFVMDPSKTRRTGWIGKKLRK